MSLNIPMPTAADMNRLTYLGAAKLKEEMSRPGGQPEKLDFSIMAGCFNCDGPMSRHTGQKVLVPPSGACRLLISGQIAVGLFSLQDRRLLLQKGMSHIAWKSESLSSRCCSVKLRIGKSGDLARTVIRFSARKTR